MDLKSNRTTLLLAVAVCYAIAGCVGLAILPGYIRGWALWPPTGLGLAAVVLLGYRALPAVWVGAVLTALVALCGSARWGAREAIAALFVGLGVTVQAFFGAWIVRRFARGAEVLHRPGTVLVFVGLGAILSTSVNATAGTLVCALAGVGDAAATWAGWVRWWLADVFSTTVLTPLLLAWRAPRRPALRSQGWWEAGAMILVLALLLGLGFGALLRPETRGTSLAFLVIPGMVWAALRFGLRGTTSVCFLVACFAVFQTVRGAGPFAVVSLPESLLLLQTFLVVVCWMTLVLAAGVAERHEIDAGLRASEGRFRELFEEVKRLNTELQRRLDELQRTLAERKQAESALRESDTRLRLALAAGRMGTWSLELSNGERVRLSPELESLFGFTPGQFDGSLGSLMALIVPEDREVVRQGIANTSSQPGEHELQFRFLAPGRSPGWLLARGRAETEGGKSVRLAGVGIEITAQKEAEQEVLRLNRELERRVGERTSQLEAINKELEAFSYSVSHDLRAPLRSVRGFSEVLLERYADKLDARGKEFLRRVCESSQHMDRLIEDLLKLSRVGRSELQHRPVDLSALATAIAGDLQQAEPQRSATVLIAPGLKAHGDERLLRIVLENLLRNAWKFTSKAPEARIEVGLRRGEPPAFFVRDNGAGFDMAYADRLFGVFQRLHSSSEFPGTGIGLATVQRIINRHGGRVWAEGAVNKGAAFYFTIPGPDGSRCHAPSGE